MPRLRGIRGQAGTQGSCVQVCVDGKKMVLQVSGLCSESGRTAGGRPVAGGLRTAAGLRLFAIGRASEPVDGESGLSSPHACLFTDRASVLRLLRPGTCRRWGSAFCHRSSATPVSYQDKSTQSRGQTWLRHGLWQERPGGTESALEVPAKPCSSSRLSRGLPSPSSHPSPHPAGQQGSAAWSPGPDQVLATRGCKAIRTVCFTSGSP